MFAFLMSQNFLSLVTVLTLVVALGTLVLTYLESRRNNKPIIKIIDCKLSFGSSIEDPRSKGKFLVRIQNLGICLYNPEIHLMIYTPDTVIMRIILPLRRKEDKTGNVIQFARGMIAEFVSEYYCGDVQGEYCNMLHLSFCKFELLLKLRYNIDI